MPTDATEEEAAVGLLVLNSGSSRDTVSTVPLKRKSLAPEPEPPAADTITCICGFAYDDGFSIGCDSCSRWCHAACFDIVDSQIPEEWECWVCRPRAVDREHAVMIQRARQRAAAAHSQADKPKRRVSSGIERKRRPSVAATADGGKRKQRRSSVNTHHTEDEHVDIDEPWTLSYVSIDKDIVPSDDTRDKLRRVATHWRGVTALESNAILPTPPIGLAQLPLSSLSHPSMFSHTNLSVRPPSYAIHASQPIPSTNFISPFTSTVIPSTAYLSDPLNAYAHLGMPKPFVHLLGPPLDVALDARFTGDQARFVRSGCRPNAVLRPMICRGEDSTLRFGIFALRDVKAHEEVVLGWEWDDGNVIHHLPALIESPHTFPPRQIDYFRLQMTSMLHALSSTFTTCACGASASDCALNRMAAFVDGQTPPTPSPSPPTNFDTNFSGPHAVFEPHRAVSEVREGENAGSGDLKVDLGPLIGVERGFRTRERVPRAGGIGGVEMVPSSPSQADCTFEQNASPSTVISNEVHTNERRETSNTPQRVPVPEAAETTRTTKFKSKDRKGKGKATDEEVTVNEDYERPRRDRRRVTIDPASISPTSDHFRSPNAMDVDRDEMLLPPRMRKAWIHKSFEALRNSIAHDAHVRGDMGSSSGTGDGEGQAQADSMEVDDSSA
ncbi:SET domain-containing protein, partial [Sparassis crispa]